MPVCIIINRSLTASHENRMFALQDLAYMPSRACSLGGYTSVMGRYWKRHALLMGHLVDGDCGDPIYSSTDPFEMMHKLKIRPAYRLSPKHGVRIARDMLYKVWSLLSHCVAAVPRSCIAGPAGPHSVDSGAAGSWHAVRTACFVGSTT